MGGQCVRTCVSTCAKLSLNRREKAEGRKEESFYDAGPWINASIFT